MCAYKYQQAVKTCNQYPSNSKGKRKPFQMQQFAKRIKHTLSMALETPLH